MSENQSEETEQSAPAEEPEVEGFAINLNSSKSNVMGSLGLGASDFAMKKKEAKDRPGLAVSDPGASGVKK